MCSPCQGHALAARRQARSWADKEAVLGHRDAKTHALRGHPETARHLSRTRDAVGSALPAPLTHARHLEAWRRGQAVSGVAPAVQADGQTPPPPPSELGELAGDELTQSH